jgi:polyhydroxybutyrate depolymerase
MAPRSPRRPARRLLSPAAQVALLLALALASGAVACSSGDDAATTTTATTPATTAVAVDLAAAVEPVGTVSHGAIEVDGRRRTYRLYVPRSLPEGPVPLFAALHGGTGWGDQFAATNGVEGLAEANGFLVVHPDGVPQPGTRGGTWNGGVCCGSAARQDVDDVAFVAALLDEVARGHDVDPARTYAFGHSNGGIMSYRLACELADRVVGIGAVAGTLGVEPCRPAQPVAVVHVHGTADANVPLAGGVGPESVAGVDFPPPPEGVATLAAADGCPAPEETTEGGVAVARHSPCRAGTAVALVTIEGGEHPWPGASAGRPGGDGGTGYDATTEIVRFLLSHPRQ